MVFVLDKRKRPLMPCSEKQARKLLKEGRAVVHRLVPFVIRLKDRVVEQSVLQSLRLKIDPGYEVTGISVVRVAEGKETVIFFAEIHHRTDITEKLLSRRQVRRSRRNRKTRYRAPRFSNRRRPEGWLPPGAEARVNQVLSVVRKLLRWLPITEIVVESARFDTQKLQNPEISGVEYQRGELFGYEVREYLLEKFGRKCAYCGKENVPLEIEHVVPKSRGGTDRVSNLTLACRECNRAKGNKLPQEWMEELKKSGRSVDRKRAENIPEVLSRLRKPLKGAAFMNATRYALVDRLKGFGLPVLTATSAQTKYNRTRFGLPKTHYYDAGCVGEMPDGLEIATEYVQVFRAVGRGTRRMCNPDKYGFPRGHREARKRYFGFSTGDLVRAVVPNGKYAGVWTGSVVVRASGFFDLKDVAGKRIAQGIHYRSIRLIQRGDGWRYDRFRREGGKAHSSSQ
ncbi:MAG: HNH endonuclease [Hydrogenibacillus schlegelii]|uniref:HNH endonuclease n=1 Tax=Hydrogenibacillus schlegelii TaxID=1484 RepID=A0A2T5G6T4_HYDSH|nr:RNA-guided endonuclease IscB [Hydrogenibacillus schlegelii]PTQ51897.1 MAG: HNH endonuclease [Hydrogenibacillus schlegelii]